MCRTNSTLTYTLSIGTHLAVIFQKILDAATSKGVRFVAINRRGFPGSTPYTNPELDVVTNELSTETEKDAFLQDRGHEITYFIDNFIREHELPPPSSDGMNGGVAILGWSLGSSHAAAAVASTLTLPADVRARLSLHLRSLIFYGELETGLSVFPVVLTDLLIL